MLYILKKTDNAIIQEKTDNAINSEKTENAILYCTFGKDGQCLIKKKAEYALL